MSVLTLMAITMISVSIIFSAGAITCILLWDKFNRRNRPMEPDYKIITRNEHIGTILYGSGTTVKVCPVCGNFLSNDVYCRYCGQLLKSEEEHEN